MTEGVRRVIKSRIWARYMETERKRKNVRDREREVERKREIESDRENQKLCDGEIDKELYFEF